MGSTGLPWSDPNSDPAGDIVDTVERWKASFDHTFADGIGPTTRPSVSSEPLEDLSGFEDTADLADDIDEYIDYVSDKYLYGTPSEE